MPGFQAADSRMAPMMAAISGRLMRPNSRMAPAAVAAGGSRRANQRSRAMKIASTSTPVISVSCQRCARGPEEIDAAQEADEQRRIAERRQRAADIGDQEDEEHDDVHVVRAQGVGADQRPHQDHGGAGGADHAGERGAEGEHGGVAPRLAAEIAGDQQPAGDRIEREQQDDEAHIFGEHARGRKRRARRRRRSATAIAASVTSAQPAAILP